MEVKTEIPKDWQEKSADGCYRELGVEIKAISLIFLFRFVILSSSSCSLL